MLENVRVTNILVLDNLSQEGVEVFQAEGFNVDVKPPQQPEELAAIIDQYDGLVIRSATNVTAEALAAASLPTRLEISGDARRDLVWGLQYMLLRIDTSEPALCSLGELAEAENENYGNNAAGVFSASFHPRHSQMPLALARRLAVLRSFMSAGIC